MWVLHPRPPHRAGASPQVVHLQAGAHCRHRHCEGLQPLAALRSGHVALPGPAPACPSTMEAASLDPWGLSCPPSASLSLLSSTGASGRGSSRPESSSSCHSGLGLNRLEQGTAEGSGEEPLMLLCWARGLSASSASAAWGQGWDLDLWHIRCPGRVGGALLAQPLALEESWPPLHPTSCPQAHPRG